MRSQIVTTLSQPTACRIVNNSFPVPTGSCRTTSDIPPQRSKMAFNRRPECPDGAQQMTRVQKFAVPSVIAVPTLSPAPWRSA
jgi:hypothetical protein